MSNTNQKDVAASTTRTSMVAPPTSPTYVGGGGRGAMSDSRNPFASHLTADGGNPNNVIARWYLATVARVRRRRDRQISSTAPPMPLDFLHRTLKAHRHVRSTYCQLFLFIPFLLAFVFLFYADRDIEGDYYSASAIRTTLLDAALPPVDASTITGSTTAASVPDDERNPYSRWSYEDDGQEIPDGYDALKQLILPILFPSVSERQSAYILAAFNAGLINSTNATVAAADHIRALFHGAVQPIGPVRIRSKHVRPSSCSSMDTTHYSNREDVKSFFRSNCFSSWSSSDEAEDWALFSTTSSVPWAPYSTKGCGNFITGTFVSLFGLIDSYNCGGFYVDLPTATTSLDDARALADTMEAERFQHGRHLRLFQVSLFLYRGAGNVYLHVNLYTEATIGGGWNVRAVVSPFRLALINGGWMAYAVLVLIFFLMFTVAFVTRGAMHYATRGTFLWTFLLQPWNVVELVNLLAFYVWFGFYCAWWSRSQEEGYLVESISARDSRDSVYPLALVEIHALYWVTSYLNSLNILFLFLKLLKFLRLNARINVLERTLIAASRSLASVVALLCLFVLAYSIAGMILYGSLLFDYRNLSEAWATSFRALIGAFDYGALHRAYRVGTFIYFWTFMVFGAFALLNFCIAILMKHFEEQYNLARLPPVLVSLQLGIESFVFYTARANAMSMVKDFVTFRSREWHRAAMLLADRCATRKLLHRIQQREEEQQRAVLPRSGSSAKPSPAPITTVRSTTGEPNTVALGASATSSSLETSSTVMLSSSAVYPSSLISYPNTDTTAFPPSGTAQEGANTSSSMGEVEDGQETTAVVLGSSATRRRRSSLIDIITPRLPRDSPARSLNGSTTAETSPPPNVAAPAVDESTPATATTSTAAVFRKKQSASTLERLQSKWTSRTSKVAAKVRDQDLIRADMTSLYQQAAASEETVCITFTDLFEEQRSAKFRSAAALKERAALQAHRDDLLQQIEDTARLTATTSLSSGTGVPTVVDTSPVDLEQVDDEIASLDHELHLLGVMMSVPTHDLETIWCRMYDEFEGTAMAQKLRAAQGRTRLVQESVTKAVSSALMPLRRRIFQVGGAPNPTSPTVRVVPSFRRKAPALGEQDADDVPFVREPSLDPSNSFLRPATMSRGVRRRVGSMIASQILPTSSDNNSSSGVLLLTNGEAADSFKHALSDMESYLGAVTKLLDSAVDTMKQQKQLHLQREEGGE